jgi:tRNA G18 (ribose-2'-O)-methylase SpoU
VELRRRIEPAEGIFIAESAEVISRALDAGMQTRSVLVEDRWLEGMADSLAIVERQGAPIFVGDRAILETIAGFHVHRGALAAMARPVLPDVGELLDRACAGVARASLSSKAWSTIRTSARFSDLLQVWVPLPCL